MEKLVTLAVDDASAQRRNIEGWIRALRLAEDAAKARPGARKRDYLVNYRIKGVKHAIKGSSAQRRNTLVELIESLSPSDKHLSTSSWIVRLHIDQAQTLVALLNPPLAQWDYVAVAEITANRSAYGDADLE